MSVPDLLRDLARCSAQARYAAFVANGVGQPSVRAGLRHQVFLGGDGFAERHIGASAPLDRLREVPRAQRRPLAKPLAAFAAAYPERREAMAQAFRTGVYTMQEIADFIGVHFATVSRAMRWLELGNSADSLLDSGKVTSGCHALDSGRAVGMSERGGSCPLPEPSLARRQE